MVMRSKGDLLAGNSNAALARGIFPNLEADQCALQGPGRPVPVYVLCARAGGNTLFRAIEGRFRTLDINLFGTLRRFRQHGHPVAQNFRETPDNRHVGPPVFWTKLLLNRFTGSLKRWHDSVGPTITQFADTQLGYQRGVPRQNTKLAFRARQRHFRNAEVQKLPLRRHNHELDGVRHSSYALAFIFSAFSSTSSIVPTM